MRGKHCVSKTHLHDRCIGYHSTRILKKSIGYQLFIGSAAALGVQTVNVLGVLTKAIPYSCVEWIFEHSTTSLTPNKTNTWRCGTNLANCKSPVRKSNFHSHFSLPAKIRHWKLNYNARGTKTKPSGGSPPHAVKTFPNIRNNGPSIVETTFSFGPRQRRLYLSLSFRERDKWEVVLNTSNQGDGKSSLQVLTKRLHEIWRCYKLWRGHVDSTEKAQTSFDVF